MNELGKQVPPEVQEGVQKTERSVGKKKDRQEQLANEEQKDVLEGDLRIQAVVQKVEQAEIEAAYADDPEQQVLLEERQEQALRLIRSVLTRVTRYVEAIYQLEHISSRRVMMDDDSFATRVSKADRRRKMAHDALISSLHAATRFIRRHFARVSETVLEDFEEQIEAEGKEFLHVQRQEMPQQILVPDTVDLHNRYAITDWAVDAHQHLSATKKEPSHQESTDVDQ